MAKTSWRDRIPVVPRTRYDRLADKAAAAQSQADAYVVRLIKAEQTIADQDTRIADLETQLKRLGSTLARVLKETKQR